MKFGFGNKAGAAGSGKFEEIKKRLQAVREGAPAQDALAQVGGGETIADDGVIPADRQTQIAKDEALVRGALALVGADYDALIAMDGASVYSQAVRANPAILDTVLSAENPVLEALKVAVGYKPVADFVGRYGSTPEDIKAAMRAEFDAELAEKDAGKKVSGPVFSSSKAAAKAPAAKKGELDDVFRR